MATRQVQWRRGTAAENDAFTGAVGEITVDTTNKQLRVHDGVTPGGAAVAPVDSPTFTGTVNGVTKEHVGLGNVDNLTPQQIRSGTTKSDVGLGNADNTADLQKPVSIAAQAALDAKAALDRPGFPDGAAVSTTRLVSSDTGVAFEDADGNRVFEINAEALTRMVAARVGDQILQNAPDGWLLTIGDAEGNVMFGVTDTGELRSVGLSVSTGSMQTVYFAFAEPWHDPSEDLAITWVSDAPDAEAVMYRPDGTSSWMTTASRRTRPFPSLSGYHLHTALISNLAPDTVYEVAWPGATLTEKVKTAPLAGVKLCVASDYQLTDFSASSRLAEFGSTVTGEAVDLVVWNGDFVNDDGSSDELYTQRWYDFLEACSDYWRNDGALVPMIGVMGNHEALDGDGSGNASYGGDGTPGPMPELFSLGFDPEHPEYERRSNYSLSIGRELFIAVIETDHTVPLSDQVAWLTTELAENAEDHRNVVVFGHSPAYFCYQAAWDTYDTQARVLRKEIWPAMQAHADKVRAYFAGHEHRLAVTAKLRMDPDPGAPETDNDRRFYTDPVGGVRQLTGGPSGSTSRNVVDPALAGLTSILDGSPRMIAALGVDPDTDTASEYGTGLTNVTPDYWNVWIAEFSSTQFEARAIRLDGLPLYTISESI